MRILGIDPGLRTTGFGVVDAQGHQLQYVASGTITTQHLETDALPARLKVLFDGIGEVVQRYQPDCASVEIVFVNVNPQSTLLLGQARGACITALVSAGLTVAEYTALQMKRAVAGHGTFHLQRGVFGHREPRRDQGRDAGAARLAQQQGGLGVDVDEHDLHAGAVGLVALNHLADAVEQHLEPRRQGVGFQVLGGDGAAGHVLQLVALCVHHAKACGAQAGIDAENSHAMFLLARHAHSARARTLNAEIPPGRMEEHGGGETQAVHPIQQAARTGDRLPLATPAGNAAVTLERLHDKVAQRPRHAGHESGGKGRPRHPGRDACQ